MAKHPVPKKKTSKGRGSRRYKAFANRAKTQLKNRINLTECSQCKKKIPLHQVCPYCGTYRGRRIFDLEKGMEKITKIKA